jgi:hypothetical protein
MYRAMRMAAVSRVAKLMAEPVDVNDVVVIGA